MGLLRHRAHGFSYDVYFDYANLRIVLAQIDSNATHYHPRGRRGEPWEPRKPSRESLNYSDEGAKSRFGNRRGDVGCARGSGVL